MTAYGQYEHLNRYESNENNVIQQQPTIWAFHCGLLQSDLQQLAAGVTSNQDHSENSVLSSWLNIPIHPRSMHTMAILGLDVSSIFNACTMIRWCGRDRLQSMRISQSQGSVTVTTRLRCGGVVYLMTTLL